MADDFNIMAAFGVLFEAAAEVMVEIVTDGPGARSQELVPKDTGALMATMRVSDPMIEIGQATVVLSYGNPDDATGIYAIVQHERLDLNHPNGGEAKYLEKAVLEAAPTFAQRVAARMK